MMQAETLEAMMQAETLEAPVEAKDIRVLYVAPEYCKAVWHHISPYVKKVCHKTGGRKAPAGVLNDLLNNYASLFVSMDGDDIVGFCFVKQVQYDTMKMLQVELLAGDRFDEWIDSMHDYLKHFAKENGCVGIELVGRRGWVKKLARFGWKEVFATVELRFSEDE